MMDEMRKAMQELAKTDEELRARLSPAAKQLLRAQDSIRAELADNRERRRKDMQRGARLTDHRINL